jgi:glutamine synthetase type III
MSILDNHVANRKLGINKRCLKKIRGSVDRIKECADLKIIYLQERGGVRLNKEFVSRSKNDL